MSEKRKRVGIYNGRVIYRYGDKFDRNDIFFIGEMIIDGMPKYVLFHELFVMYSSLQKLYYSLYH